MKLIPRYVASFTASDIAATLFSQKRSQPQDPLSDFAREFAGYIGVSYAIPSPSGREALRAILHALALPPGGEVILPSLIFHCIPAIFAEFGLQPCFVDIDPRTYCIDATRIESAITPSTVALFPVHLYGRACNMELIKHIADRYRLVIIEDCAQSCGALYLGKRLGNFGQAAIFSFSPHKNLSVLGMGMAVTGSSDLAKKITSRLERVPRIGDVALAREISYVVAMRFVTHPWFWDPFMATALRVFDALGIDLIGALTNESKHSHKAVRRICSYMPKSSHGKIGLFQLPKLDALNRIRVHNGDTLLRYLEGVSGIGLPAPSRPGENIYSTFVIQVKDRQRFRKRLRRLGVDTHEGDMSVGPNVSGFIKPLEAKNAFDAVTRVVHLPVYPGLKELDLFKIAQSVKTASLELATHESSE